MKMGEHMGPLKRAFITLICLHQKTAINETNAGSLIYCHGKGIILFFVYSQKIFYAFRFLMNKSLNCHDLPISSATHLKPNFWYFDDMIHDSNFLLMWISSIKTNVYPLLCGSSPHAASAEANNISTAMMIFH